MAIDFSYIDHDILGDVADAIRFVEGSTAGIAPADYPQRIRALDNYIPDYDVLNFTLPNGGTISLNKIGNPTVVELEYWLDDNGRWIIWQPDANGNRSLTLTDGQRMYVRNTSEIQTGFSTSLTDDYRFSFSADTYANGNINSLLCKNAESVTSLSAYCFFALFNSCTYLLTPPELPATTIALSCYRGMFAYTSIVIAPELPATVLSSGCYKNMFYICVKLKEIRTMMTDISAIDCTDYWLTAVSAQGDFYCPAELTITTGDSGIPSGWTRHDI